MASGPLKRTQPPEPSSLSWLPGPQNTPRPKAYPGPLNDTLPGVTNRLLGAGALLWQVWRCDLRVPRASKVLRSGQPGQSLTTSS